MVLINIYGFYASYKNARDASWQALIDFNVSALPVSLINICNLLNIAVIDNSTARELREGESGIAIYQGDSWYIVIDDTDTPQRQRFTIAHELGHILMGHGLKNGYHTRRDNLVKSADESAADMFAARLLAPSCVLWGINAVTPTQIATVCNISKTAAYYRADRLAVLRRRDRFLTSPLERQVYEQFGEFIKNNRLQ